MILVAICRTSTTGSPFRGHASPQRAAAAGAGATTAAAGASPGNFYEPEPNAEEPAWPPLGQHDLAGLSERFKSMQTWLPAKATKFKPEDARTNFMSQLEKYELRKERAGASNENSAAVINVVSRPAHDHVKWFVNPNDIVGGTAAGDLNVISVPSKLLADSMIAKGYVQIYVKHLEHDGHVRQLPTVTGRTVGTSGADNTPSAIS